MAKEKKAHPAEQEEAQDKAAAQAAAAGEQEEAAETGTEQDAAKAEAAEPSKEEELNAQIEALKDRLMRSAAEFDNYKKRTSKEKEDFYASVVCEIIAQLLPVLDNLQRAVDAAEVSGGADLMEGVKMIRRQFEEALGGIGIEPIEAVGKPFDPEIHDAVMRDEEAEAEENTVTEEFMKGYRYKGKVIRHSMVKVAN